MWQKRKNVTKKKKIKKPPEKTKSDQKGRKNAIKK